MVKPGDSVPHQQSASGHNSMSQPTSGGPPESGDFESFIVLERSPQDSLAPSGAFGNGMTSLNGSVMMPPISFNMQPVENSSLRISSLPELSPEEVQRKLQEVLRENIELKETLQQNNLAMKQQFNTLIAWQEDVVRVHQNHKEKFEDTRALITKLKAEKANLIMLIESQPDSKKMRAENEELKSRVQMLEQKIATQDALLQDNSGLREQISELEHQLEESCCASDGQQRAERRACELSEERVQLLRENEELKQRTLLLQSELASAQENSYIMVETDRQATPKREQQNTPRGEPGEKLAHFYNMLDQYEENMAGSYKRIDQQVERFSYLYGWLQEASDKLPSSSPAVDMMALQSMLEGLRLRLREAQASSTDHRLRLEQTGQQMGRLASEFQALLQEWVDVNRTLKDKAPNTSSETQNLKQLSRKADQLTAQLLEAEEKLLQSERALADQKAMVARRDASLSQLNSKLGEAQSRQSFSEQVDHVMAQLLEAQDNLARAEKALGDQKATVTQRESTLAQANDKLTQQEAAMAQRQAELRQAEKKLVSLEQKVDALTAQAEVFKMDFQEERESREQLATEKNRMADELRDLEQRNKQLDDELAICRAQLEETPQLQQRGSTSAPLSGSRPNYNTIATPGRGRTQAPREQSPKYECPKCQLRFTTLQPLQNHVELCLDMDMFP